MIRSKLSKLLSLTLFLLVALVSQSRLPLYAQSEELTEDSWVIEQYSSTISLSESASISIVEELSVNYQVDKHGILRRIPVHDSSQSLLSQKRDTKVDVSSVVDQNGNPWMFEEYREGDYLVLKIGDPNKLVSGNQFYKISYTVKDGIDFYDEVDELYWNGVGAEWTVPIRNATVKVDIPFEYEESEVEIACYRGNYGSDSTQGCNIEENDGIVQFSAQELSPYEGVTIYLGFPKGLIEEPGFWERYGLLIVVNSGILLPLPVLAGAFLFWRKHGKDPKGRATIVPTFNPSEGMTPAYAGFLLNNRMDQADLSAVILDLAIRGYIRIIESEKGGIFGGKEYSLELKKSEIEALSTSEQLIMNGIFSENLVVGSVVQVKSLENRFYKTFQEVSKEVARHLTSEGFYNHNPRTLSAIMLGAGIVVIFLGFSAFSIFAPFNGFLTPVGIIGSGAIISIFAPFMPQMSPKGVTSYEELKGLEMYMSIAEKDRINVHQGADSNYLEKEDVREGEKGVKLFEKLLPYAVIFGVEDKWASKFENIYKDSSPTWYSGTTPYYQTSILTNSLMSSLGSVTNSMTSQPRSSGSGGGGGGFSGGGGGGGGGSSW